MESRLDPVKCGVIRWDGIDDDSVYAAVQSTRCILDGIQRSTRRGKDERNRQRIKKKVNKYEQGKLEIRDPQCTRMLVIHGGKMPTWPLGRPLNLNADQ